MTNNEKINKYREDFVRSLESTRKLVASWPEWKRNALGPVISAPHFDPIDLNLRDKNKKFLEKQKPICPNCRAFFSLINDDEVKCNHCYKIGKIKDGKIFLNE